MNHTRKDSPRTFKMESTGPKVPSRYLSGRTGSCHDNCKPSIETRTKDPSPKRIPKPPTDRIHLHATNSVQRINKPPSVTPKSTTRNVKNNNVVKDQILKKDASIEPKKRDFKLKSVDSQAKTYTRPPSTNPRRRLSDTCVPNKNMSLPSSGFPKRRLSEIIVHPNKDVASVSNGSMGRGFGINKNISRKDSKLPSVNKKPNSVKTIVSTSKISAKVSPLRTYKSIPKPEPKGPRKSKPEKPVEEFVHEETLHDTEPNIEVEITKSQSQSQMSHDRFPPSSEVKTMKDDENEEVESSPPLVEDDKIHVKDGEASSAEGKSMKDDQNAMVESSQLPLENDENAVMESLPPPLKDAEKMVVDSSTPTIEDDENVMVNSSPPPLKDDENTLMESSPPLLEACGPNEVAAYSQLPLKDDENKAVESSPPTLEVFQNEVVESSPPSLEDDQHEVVNIPPPSIEDETHAKYGQQSDNVSDSKANETNEMTSVKTLVVETSDCSPDDLRFKRGTILSPESQNNSLIELQFKKGKELENETEAGENISVDLKHQETEEKKAAVLSNNVIEETASKLIQTRKSKVKALVGAFETIVSAESPRK